MLPAVVYLNLQAIIGWFQYLKDFSNIKVKKVHIYKVTEFTLSGLHAMC
jgi:hypothetical protein